MHGLLAVSQGHSGKKKKAHVSPWLTELQAVHLELGWRLNNGMGLFYFLGLFECSAIEHVCTHQGTRTLEPCALGGMTYILDTSSNSAQWQSVIPPFLWLPCWYDCQHKQRRVRTWTLVRTLNPLLPSQRPIRGLWVVETNRSPAAVSSQPLMKPATFWQMHEHAC